MGQYYKIVNLTKKQYLHPHRFGDGLKLMEFSMSASGVMAGLAILLADGNGRGSGDLHSDNPIIGSWAGDRIVIAGDYADEGKWEHKATIYSHCDEEEGNFTDVGEEVLMALLDDHYFLRHTARIFRDNEFFGGGPAKYYPNVVARLKDS